MTNTLRIRDVAHMGWPAYLVGWTNMDTSTVSLGGWIATGGAILAPLKDMDLFASAKVGEYGASIYWGDPDGDLAIDATHLKMLADEQKSLQPLEINQWQADVGLSNQEAADFFEIALSTWNAYKAGADVPRAIGMVCRTTRRDPLLMQAHYRPRRAGRPRKPAKPAV